MLQTEILDTDVSHTDLPSDSSGTSFLAEIPHTNIVNTDITRTHISHPDMLNTLHTDLLHTDVPHADIFKTEMLLIDILYKEIQNTALLLQDIWHREILYAAIPHRTSCTLSRRKISRIRTSRRHTDSQLLTRTSRARSFCEQALQRFCTGTCRTYRSSARTCCKVKSRSFHFC